MSKQAGGIRGVLDGILSQEKQQPSLLPAAATAIAQLAVAIGQTADNPTCPTRRDRVAAGRWARPHRPACPRRKSHFGSIARWPHPTAIGHGKSAANSATWSRRP